MEIDGAHALVMGCGMMLGEIISIVFTAGFPIDVELLLVNTVAYPVETHVNCFGSLYFYVVAGNSGGC